MNDNNPMHDNPEWGDNDVRLLALGLLLILVGLLYFFDIIPAAAQGYGGPRMWGFERPEAYEAPPCNARYNPDCGRFGWEGPRSRQWRYERHPMMPDAPRGRGYPSERRYLALVLASPLWRDRIKISKIYEEAKRLTEKTGIPHEVDHIYPIQSKFACGLHVHHNLQILEKNHNRSKKNKFPLFDSPALRP